MRAPIRFVAATATPSASRAGAMCCRFVCRRVERPAADRYAEGVTLTPRAYDAPHAGSRDRWASSSGLDGGDAGMA